MNKHKHIIILLILAMCGLWGQHYRVGDYVDNFSDSLCSMNAQWSLFDYYGEVNGGNQNVIWLIFFNSSSRKCQLEASYTQLLSETFNDDGLVTLGIGSGWDENLTCKDWAKNFGVVFPIISDDRLNLRNLFADGTVPHHVLIDHTMRIVYSAKGSIMPPNGSDFLVTLNTALQNMNTLSSINDDILPQKVKLNPCYPNPFNNKTTINYEIREQTHVAINVIDIQGNGFYPLKMYNAQTPGQYSFSWDADEFSSGVYFIQLVTDFQTLNQKVLLVK